MAELGDFRSFVAVTEHAVIRFDPNVKKGSILKEYGGNLHFRSIAVREDASYAIGNETGEVRLYDKRFPTTAASKYPAFGDPVLYMESTKDGEWLLATFKEYILLLPTCSNEGHDLYAPGSWLNERPDPRRLTVKPEHRKFGKGRDEGLAHAKFDESRSRAEKFIVSGFGEYIIVWSLGNVIAGNTNYTVTLR